MSHEAPIVADARRRLRDAVAALPPTERAEWARRLDLGPREVETVLAYLLGRWRLPRALARWFWLGDPGGAAPFDRRCYLGAPRPVARQPRDKPVERA